MTKKRKSRETIETVGGVVNFDKEYWPKSGTVVPSIPTDLNELWDEREDQASVFVAEAILSDPPHGHVSFDEADATLVAYLWSVGGDTLCLDVSLSEAIEDGVRVYDKIRGPAQEEDVKSYIPKLEQVEAAIVRAKAFLQQQLDEYAKSKESE